MLLIKLTPETAPIIFALSLGLVVAAYLGGRFINHVRKEDNHPILRYCLIGFRICLILAVLAVGRVIGYWLA